MSFNAGAANTVDTSGNAHARKECYKVIFNYLSDHGVDDLAVVMLAYQNWRQGLCWDIYIYI